MSYFPVNSDGSIFHYFLKYVKFAPLVQITPTKQPVEELRCRFSKKSKLVKPNKGEKYELVGFSFSESQDDFYVASACKIVGELPDNPFWVNGEQLHQIFGENTDQVIVIEWKNPDVVIINNVPVNIISTQLPVPLKDAIKEDDMEIRLNRRQTKSLYGLMKTLASSEKGKDPIFTFEPAPSSSKDAKEGHPMSSKQFQFRCVGENVAFYGQFKAQAVTGKGRVISTTWSHFEKLLPVAFQTDDLDPEPTLAIRGGDEYVFVKIDSLDTGVIDSRPLERVQNLKTEDALLSPSEIKELIQSKGKIREESQRYFSESLERFEGDYIEFVPTQNGYQIKGTQLEIPMSGTVDPTMSYSISKNVLAGVLGTTTASIAGLAIGPSMPLCFVLKMTATIVAATLTIKTNIKPITPVPVEEVGKKATKKKKAAPKSEEPSPAEDLKVEVLPAPEDTLPLAKAIAKNAGQDDPQLQNLIQKAEAEQAVFVDGEITGVIQEMGFFMKMLGYYIQLNFDFQGVKLQVSGKITKAKTQKDPQSV